VPLRRRRGSIIQDLTLFCITRISLIETVVHYTQSGVRQGHLVVPTQTSRIDERCEWKQKKLIYVKLPQTKVSRRSLAEHPPHPQQVIFYITLWKNLPSFNTQDCPTTQILCSKVISYLVNNSFSRRTTYDYVVITVKLASDLVCTGSKISCECHRVGFRLHM